MPETRELQAVVNLAEQAATDGDYVAAERLLREVALLQEARLGPLHPDLANTLNNLGVVCDFGGKLADAEVCYRRAYAIATAAFASDHPFVATSRKNLEDFCRIRGRPFEPQTAAPPTAVELEPPSTDSVAAPDEPNLQLAAEAGAPGRSLRPLVVGALVAGALVLVVFLWAGSWFQSSAPAESSVARPRQSLSPTAEPLSAGAIPAAEATTARETTTRSDRPSGPKAKAELGRTTTRSPIGASASVATVVAEARLCRDLSTGSRWTCEPPSRPVGAGSLFFYTRIKSGSDATVEHRWYRGDRLLSMAKLRVRASPTEGYRTYSRHNVDGQGAGDWRVELRTEDGILVHEERFVVR